VSTHPVPFIPASAPFTPEQRGWLNGLLAGLFSAASASPAVLATPAKSSLPVTILHASQTGTGEGLARKLAKVLKSRGHAPDVAALEAQTPRLAGHHRARHPDYEYLW